MQGEGLSGSVEDACKEGVGTASITSVCSYPEGVKSVVWAPM